MPGLPVLQNGFGSPGLAVAANYGEGRRAFAYGAAISYGLSNGRAQATVGVGGFDPKEGASSVAYGIRGQGILLQRAGGSFGVAAFGGVGGSNADDVNILSLVAGLGFGYRWAPADRAFSLYGTPVYRRDRNELSDGSSITGDLFRIAVGADFAVLARLGVTIGYELGQEASLGEPGPTGGVFGVGVSYSLR